MASKQILPTLTAEQLRAALDYDPLTGVFRWKWRDDVALQINNREAGTVAGCVSRPATGHMKITLNGGSYFLHRLVWLYVTGEWPTIGIDHIDNNAGNNRFTNLRLATTSQNQMNQRMTVGKIGNLKGARFHKSTGRWQASITVDRKSHYLGLFDTAEEAHAAYCEAATRLFGEFARFS